MLPRAANLLAADGGRCGRRRGPSSHGDEYTSLALSIHSPIVRNTFALPQLDSFCGTAAKAHVPVRANQ